MIVVGIEQMALVVSTSQTCVDGQDNKTVAVKSTKEKDFVFQSFGL